MKKTMLFSASLVAVLALGSAFAMQEDGTSQYILKSDGYHELQQPLDPVNDCESLHENYCTYSANTGAPSFIPTASAGTYGVTGEGTQDKEYVGPEL